MEKDPNSSDVVLPKTVTVRESKMMAAPNAQDFSICKILYALSEPTRLEIVRMIDEAGGELRCGFFAQRIGLSKPTLSHHLGILRDAGVLATRLEGTQKLNTIRRDSLNERFPGLLASILTGLDPVESLSVPK